MTAVVDSLVHAADAIAPHRPFAVVGGLAVSVLSGALVTLRRDGAY